MCKSIVYIIFLIFSILSNPAFSSLSDISGVAIVVDGDTLKIKGVSKTIRLYGIDAPEKDQFCSDYNNNSYQCGSLATEALSTIIGKPKWVSCVELDQDHYGRVVAECYTFEGVSINSKMVKEGWAIEYVQCSDGRYSSDEQIAKVNGLGLWEGNFVEPWLWRHKPKAKNDFQNAVSPENCLIKGNISRNGRIYHVPGQEYYTRTRINPSKGEKWFCTEKEARSSGWRPAKR